MLQSLGVGRGRLEILSDSEVFVALVLEGLDFRGQTAHVVSGARAVAAARRVRAMEVDCGSSRGRGDAECCADAGRTATGHTDGHPLGKPFRPDARLDREFVRRATRPFPCRCRERTTKLPTRAPGALGVGRAGRREGVGRGPDGLPGRRFRGGGAKHVGAARGGARPPPGRAARDVRGRGEDRRREGVRGPARRAVVAGARRRRRRARARRRGERR